MMDMYRLQANIDEELRKIAEKGFSTNNIDNAMKLVCMEKDIKNIEYWETKKEYYNSILDEMNNYSGLDGSNTGNRGNSNSRNNNGGYSSRRRNSNGRYVRDGKRYDEGWDDYMNAKHSYQSNKSEDCKSRMLSVLEEKMSDLTSELSEMANDSDCREERDVIRKYINKLQSVL